MNNKEIIHSVIDAFDKNDVPLILSYFDEASIKVKLSYCYSIMQFCDLIRIRNINSLLIRAYSIIPQFSMLLFR